MDVLISIKPKYVSQILDGIKKVEYRKTIPNIGQSDLLVLYETAPTMMVTGYCRVDSVMEDTVEGLWNRTSDVGGIKKEDYFQYFHGREVASCLVLKDVVRLKEPIPLSEFGFSHPPQSWRYLKDKDKLKSIF